jgi:hypothetical protein
MPKVLSNFRRGSEVEITCCKEGCEKAIVPVVLGQGYSLHPDFVELGNVGRIIWKRGAVMKGFELSVRFGGSGYCRCPNCRTLFGGVIVIFNGLGKKPIIFGYDPEPA